jgi:hypothetical protein
MSISMVEIIRTNRLDAHAAKFIVVECAIFPSLRLSS